MSKKLEDLTDKEYRAQPYESFSSLKFLLDTPKAYFYNKEHPFQGSPSTLLGTAVHHYLQGNRHLVAFNVFNRVTKQGKEDYEKFEKEFRALSDEAIIVPKSFEEKLQIITKNLNEMPKAIELLDKCQFEVPYIFNVDGVDIKGKLDGVGVEDSFICEIKTTSRDVDLHSFRSQAKDSHYDLQAYLYQHAVGGKKPHYFIVVHTIAPYEVKVYRSSSDFLKNGEIKAKHVVASYKRYVLNKEPWIEDNIEEL